MSLHPAIIFAGGLVVVIVGAELLLRGASRVAARLGIRPIIIGLTVVALGTSIPELAVGLTAVREGKGPLAVGNIAGANIYNILFILGLTAAIRPLPIQLLSIRLDVPAMIASAAALFVMAWDGVLSRTEGVLLVLGAVVYTAALVRMSRREGAEVRQEFGHEYSAHALHARRGAAAWAWDGLLLAAGIGLTLVGADLLVAGAVLLARSFGISESVIGLTVVAIGTSAPELATTVVATVKNERDIAVGNLIGSATYNILAILGVVCALAPEGVVVSPDVLRIDLSLGAVVAALCLPVFWTDRLISRREGIAFVLTYVAYLATIVGLRV